VRGGRVLLHGEVAMALQRTAAARAVRQLPGVRAVDNLIKVKPQAEPTATEVKLRVQEAIAHLADRHSRSLEVTMTDGTVRLHGKLPSREAIETARRAAEGAPGVTTVESEIVVTP